MQIRNGAQPIIVNCRFLSQAFITGVQRFATEIALELKNIDPSIIFVSPRNIFHKDVAKRLDVVSFGKYSGHLWEQLELPLYLYRNYKNSVLINLLNSSPIFHFNKITTIHDIALVRHPEAFATPYRIFYKLLVPLILRSSQYIITDSNFSKKEINQYYKYNKIMVVYSSVNSGILENRIKKNDSNSNYILTVGSLSNKRKNISVLINAFNKLSNQNIELLIVGKDFKEYYSTQNNYSSVISNKIKFLSDLTDDQLFQLYQNARLFVYPSIYEGFGIPILESQKARTPVIASDVEVFREIHNDSILYFNPYDPLDLANKMELLLNDKWLAQDLVKKGEENLHKYSWHTSALKIYNSIADGIK